MAAKRIHMSAIDWLKMSELVPSHQRAQFVAFKAKYDSYMKRVLDLPNELPHIDWNMYRKIIQVPGMVDDYEKKYNAVEVPYPPDTVSHQFIELEEELKADIEKIKVESDLRIAASKKELDRLNSLVPFDQMTMDDYWDAFPEDRFDPLKRPTFWPHTPEEQLEKKVKKKICKPSKKVQPKQ